MPFWRKKNTEFEWQKHVRTTILLRRQKRRQKLEDAGAAAAFGVRQAKWKSIAHTKAAAQALVRGSAAAGRALSRGSKAAWHYSIPKIQEGNHALKRNAANAASKFSDASLAGAQKSKAALGQANARVVKPAAFATADWVRRITRPVLQRLSSPQLFGPICILATVASLGAMINLYQFGATSEALFITGLALALVGIVVLAWPARAYRQPRLPNVSLPTLTLKKSWRPSTRLASLAGFAGLFLLASIAAFWQFKPQLPSLPSLNMMSDIAIPDIVPDVDLSKLNPLKSEIIEGRGRALDGGHIRVAKQTVRLDNIEALLPAQTCKTKRGRRWRCGRRAKSQLSRIIKRDQLSCQVTGQDDDGVKRVICTAKGADIAAVLVEKGYAFANLGMFASYRSQEDAARQKKVGVWQGPATRPSEYKLTSWDKAAEKAPDGCPIKGRIVRRKRLYALPWDRGYTRVRIRPRRGEKWFCSEQDAINAGFKHAGRI